MRTLSDYLAGLGTLGFTYRTRRLADRIADAGRRFYDALEVPLEPNWHALLLYLETEGNVSVTEAAAALRVSHPAVIEMARRMEAKGLITAHSDPADGRRRVLALSAEGLRQLPRFKALWAVIAGELDDIIALTAGGDAMACLTGIEEQLDQQELDVRVLHRLEQHRLRPPSSSPANDAVAIRPLEDADREAVLHIARELVRTADTYAYDPSISDEELWRCWSPSGSGTGFAAQQDGQIAGIFVIRPNIPGPGSHVCNASFAVRADVRGLGLGRHMGEAALALAAELGYAAMQFNTVVSTNTGAVRLWRSLGFGVVGTIPDGFTLPDGETVACYVMYRRLP